MSETTPSRKRVKPARHARLSPVGESGRRILTLYVGKEAFVYWLAEVGTDFGRGFSLEKFDGGDVYSVHLDPAGDSCSCIGHLRHGHRTVCKHVGAVKGRSSAPAGCS